MTPRRKSTEIDWLDAAMDGDEFALRAMGKPPAETPAVEPVRPNLWHDIVTIMTGSIIVSIILWSIIS